MIRNRFNRPSAVAYPNSGPIQPEYAKILKDDGSFEVEKVGEVDIRVVINAPAESCDIYAIIDRYQRGDIDALNRVKGFYGDVRGLPSSLMEAYKCINNAQSNFTSLPFEIRQHFNNDPKQFVARANDESTKEIFKNYISAHSPQMAKREEVEKEV